MKRRFLLFLNVLMVVAFSVNAQTTTSAGPSFESLQKQVQKSDAEIQSSDKAASYKTWYKRAILMQNCNEANLGGGAVVEGTPVIQLEFTMGKATEKQMVTAEDGSQSEIYVYPRIDFKMQNGVVVSWKEKEPVVENPLEKAIEAFNKCIDLDVDGKYTKKVAPAIEKLKNQLAVKGRIEYNNKNYEDAARLFGITADLPQIINKFNEILPETAIDSSAILNAGLANYGVQNYEKSIQYFEKTAQLGFEPKESYLRLYWSSIELKDTTKALNYLNSAIKDVPDESTFLLLLIDIYIKQGEIQKAIDYIQEAKNAEPTNVRLYAAEGSLLVQLKKYDDALNAYKKATEIDPEFYEAFYSMGAMYYQKASDMFTEANNIKDNKAYNKAVDDATATLKLAIEPFEKARHMDVKDMDMKKSILEYLKSIYFRLSMTPEGEGVKAELENL